MSNVMSETISNENQGEGNRDAADAYNRDTRRFISEGRVESAARQAAALPRDRQAENAGKRSPSAPRQMTSSGSHSLSLILIAGAAGYLLARILAPTHDRD